MIKRQISIVIPVHNREDSLKKCLSAVFTDINLGKHKDVEVIVVDDYSTENLRRAVNKFPAKYLRLKKKSGPSVARNLGVKKANGEIIFFVDSDVLLQSGVLERLKNDFKKDRDIVAVQGNYTKNAYSSNFFTKYKNILLNYNFSKYDKKYGKGIATFCVAIKGKALVLIGGFNENLKTANIEDEAPGVLIYSKGMKILFDSQVNVKHLKKHNLYNLLKQDYDTTFLKIKSYLKIKKISVNRLEESHLGIRYLSTIPLSNLILLNILLLLLFSSVWLNISLLSLSIIYLILSSDMYYYFLSSNGFMFTIKSFLFGFVNNLVIAIAIIFGFFHYILKAR